MNSTLIQDAFRYFQALGTRNRCIVPQDVEFGSLRVYLTVAWEWSFVVCGMNRSALEFSVVLVRLQWCAGRSYRYLYECHFRSSAFCTVSCDDCLQHCLAFEEDPWLAFLLLLREANTGAVIHGHTNNFPNGTDISRRRCVTFAWPTDVCHLCTLNKHRYRFSSGQAEANWNAYRFPSKPITMRTTSDVLNLINTSSYLV